jgi:hypothetical protein
MRLALGSVHENIRYLQRSTGGAWSEPVKLGPEVNSPSIELCPIVTADGKYLFFLSQRDGESHAYWVRADFIDKMRPIRAENIHEAAKKGDLSRVKQMLEKDPELLNAKGEYDRTPLLQAVLSKQEETFKYLVDGGADEGMPSSRRMRNTLFFLSIALTASAGGICTSAFTAMTAPGPSPETWGLPSTPKPTRIVRSSPRTGNFSSTQAAAISTGFPLKSSKS